MRQLRFSAVLAVAIASSGAVALEYITDLPLYSSLAPCAQSAIRYNVQVLTSDACPDGVTQLQSCVCTKNNNFRSITSLVSSSVSFSCGSMASDDQASVSTVLSAYCDPSATITFPALPSINEYIFDIPEHEYLAPCAKSAIKWAIGSVTYEGCPTEAPAVASCLCLKNQNSRFVSQRIHTEVKSSCSEHTADMSSAQAMFAAYCNMNNGTTSFPVPSRPPGDMTYYITDLPQYSSLAPCAADGLSFAVLAQTMNLCPEGPQALASCVCLKDGMTTHMSKVITSSVKWECASTASEDVSSALSVYDYYCSAARGQVTAVGVSNSVEQTYPASRDPGGPRETGGSSSGNGNGNGDGNGNSDGSGGTGDATEGGETENSGGASTGVIVGAVVGGIGGLALIGVAIFFVMKSARKRKAMEQATGPDGSVPGTDASPAVGIGKQGFPGDTAAAALLPPSPSPSTLNGNAASRLNNVSPASATTAADSTPPPNQSELHGQSVPYPPIPNHPELHGQGVPVPPPPGSPSMNTPELYGQGNPHPDRPELQGHGAMAMYAHGPRHPDRPELQGQGTQYYNANPNRPELPGQGAMYAPPPDRPELQGQGTQFHHANPNRPELAGQYVYPGPQPPPPPSPMAPQQQQQQQPYPHPSYGAPPQQAPPPQAYHQPYPGSPTPGQPGQPPATAASWQSGPMSQHYYEMDAGRHGTPPR